MVKKFYYKDILFEVGESAYENTNLIKESSNDYYWLHMDLIPSPHVIIHTDTIDTDIINFASSLCQDHCSKKYKLSNSFYTISTRISNLDITEVPGEVEFKKTGKKHLKKHFIQIL